MKNLSFFKGLLIGGFFAISVWVIAISSVISVLDSNDMTNQETVRAEISSSNPPS